jgi:hypothetical protein
MCVHNDVLLDSQADLYLQEHLLQTPGHLNNQSEAVVFSEGEKPPKVRVFTMVSSLTHKLTYGHRNVFSKPQVISMTSLKLSGLCSMSYCLASPFFACSSVVKKI